MAVSALLSLSTAVGPAVALAANTGSAGPSAPTPGAFSPETAPEFSSTFTPPARALSPKCPNAIAGTPGSDTASKVLNAALNTAGSFVPGGTVHYTYRDDAHGAAYDYTIQDCEVVYPAGFFEPSDFDSATGVLRNPAFTKSVLDANGTEIGGASLSGTLASASDDAVYFSWTSPDTLAVGSWVCNFARDIKADHGGGGNRKAVPTCYQVRSPIPTLSLSYAAGTSSTEAQGSTAGFVVHVALSGQPDANAPVTVTITGPNAQTLTASTDANGDAKVDYQGNALGTDTITATSGQGTANHLSVTWIAPALTLAFAAGTSASEQQGATAGVDLAVTLAGQPDANAPVTFTVVGVNAQTLSTTTDPQGDATFTYQGKAQGTDTITATSSQATSNQLAVTWTAPLASVAATQAVTGQFFAEPPGETGFVAQPGDTPAFAQSFPDLAFNPPAGLLPIPPGAPTPSTVPFTDVVTDAGGAYAGTMPAEGNGYQAGTSTAAGDLSNFDAVFTGSLVVAKPGYLTLGVISGDGFLLGVGGGATSYSGAMDHAPVPATTAFGAYPLMAANDSCLSTAGSNAPGDLQPGDYPVTIDFPAAGTYPYELDYFSCDTSVSGSPVRSLVLRVESVSPTAPSSPTIYLGSADTSRQPNDLFHYFPYPWAGTPGVDFQGCAPASACAYDAGAVRVDNTTNAPITVNKLVVTLATPNGPNNAPYSCVYDIWAPDAPAGVPESGSPAVVLPPGQTAVYTQENAIEGTGCNNTDGEFDTSDVPGTACVDYHIVPQVALTINGTTTTYDDSNQILNTGGLDRAICTPAPLDNESTPWTRIAGPGTGADVPLPPEAGLTLQPTQAENGGPLSSTVNDEETFTATATAADGSNLAGVPVTFVVTGANPQRVTVDTDSAGAASFTYLGANVGTDTISATGSYQGLEMASGQVQMAWQIPPPGQTTGSGGTPAEAPPEVSVTSPADGSTLTAGTPVHADVTPPPGQTISSWSVSLTSGGGAPTTVASGSGTPPPTLATLDPTHLVAGAYQLSVSATASGGGVNTATVSFQVARTATVGQFAEVYTDIATQLASVPVTIQRVYQSFDKTVGDFGVGWHLSLTHVSVATNGPLGAGGWAPQPTSCSLFGCSYQYQSSRPHTATVTLPDATQEVFDFTPTGGGGPLFFLGGAGRFTPRPGTNTTGTLAPVEDPGVYYGFDGNLYTTSSAGLDLYALTDYLYTDAHGTQYLISTSFGLLAERSANGACVAFTPGQILGATGTSGVADLGYGIGSCTGGVAGGAIGIGRDSQHRITDIHLSTGGVYGTDYLYSYDSAGDLTTVTLPGSMGTDAYTYDGNHDLLSQSGPGAPTLTQTYDANGNLVSVTDGDGRTFPVSNDPAARTETVTDALGRLATVLSFDPAGHLVSKQEISAGQSRTTSYTYDALGDVTSVTDPLGNTTTYTYDSDGNQTSVTDARGDTATTTYDGLGQVTSRTNPIGETTNTTYDAAGNLVSIVDPSGAATTLAYDAYGDPTSLTDPAGNTSTFAYGYGPGLPSAMTNPLGNVTTIGQYDEQIQSISDPLNETTGYGYDPLGRVVSARAPTGATTSYAYDAEGNVSSVTDPDGNTTSYSYDAAGRLTHITDANGGVVTLGYDEDGNLTSVTDADGHVTTYTYDGFGDRVTATDPSGAVTSYAYDADGRVISTTDARGQVTTYGYDADGRVVTRVTPQATTTWAYDAAGRLTAMTDATGTTTYTYDTAGRVVQVASPEGTLGYTYTADGERASMTLPGGSTITYRYDKAGNLTSESGLGQTVDFTYDPANRLTTIAYPDGVTTRYGYDGDSNISSISSANGSNVLQSLGYQRDADGNPTVSTDTSGTTTYSYDKLDRLLSVTGPGSGSSAYTYDAAGNITSATSGGTTVPYTYDSAGQLTAVGAQPVTTDADGNITGIGSTSFAWDAQSQLAAVTTGGATTSYTYDGSGLRVATTGPGTTTDLWDPVNPLTGSLDTVPAAPSAGGSALAPVPPLQANGSPSSTVEAALAPGSTSLPQLVSDGTGSYVDRLGQTFGEVSPSGTATWYLSDDLGSVTATVGTSGAVTGTSTYAPYGAVSGHSGATTSIGYTGQLQDPTGLLYLRARYLDPVVGRFLSVDSAQPNAPGTQGYNAYAYAADGPTARADPSGHGALQFLIDEATGLISGITFLSVTHPEFWGLAPPGFYTVRADTLAEAVEIMDGAGYSASRAVLELIAAEFR